MHLLFSFVLTIVVDIDSRNLQMCDIYQPWAYCRSVIPRCFKSDQILSFISTIVFYSYVFCILLF